MRAEWHPGAMSADGVPGFEERLRVPGWWWPVAAALVVLLGAELHGGFGWIAAIVTDGTLGLLVAAALVQMGRARITVDGQGLRAGPSRLPLHAVGEVHVLDAKQTRAALGPAADPTGFVFARPWLHQAVYVEVVDGEHAAPYWLLTSRRPHDLATVLSRAAGSARQDGQAGVG